MAKHDDIEKDLNDGEDEDLLGFDFDEDLLGEEEEVKEKEEETIDLVDALLEDEGGVEKKPKAASEEEREDAEDVLPEKSEVKEKLFESAAWEVVSQYPSGQEEEAGEETVPMKEMEEPVKKETLPISKEKIEALLGKVVSDVLEKVAREVIPEK